MAGDLSGQTTGLSNLSVGGKNANGTVFGSIWAGSDISAPTFAFSALTVTSAISTPNLSVVSLNVQGGVQASGVTLDLRTNSVIPSVVTYGGGASISGLTIGQWGFVQNASGFSIAFSSGKTAYFFGGSTLSAAIT